MKIGALFFCQLFLVLISYGKFISTGASGNEVKVLTSNENEIILEITTASFKVIPVNINNKVYNKPVLLDEGGIPDKGLPDLPAVTRSIIISDNLRPVIEVLSNEYIDYDLPVAPSKGLILRGQDPSLIPYEFGSIYQLDRFFPGDLAEVGEPYIFRDFRGANIHIHSFLYNPVQEKLRVYTKITVRISYQGVDTRNVKKRSGSVNHYFGKLYESHFLNYSDNSTREVVENGRMIVICYDTFLATIQPYVNWKNQKGIQTDLYAISTIGNTAGAIQNFIQNQYDLEDGLTFVQLVGDAEQIATPIFNTGESDPSYSLLEGNDNYPEIIIGRFSAETVGQLETQVERTIYYERDLNAGAWLHKGTGIASDQGAGVGWQGLADWEHMNILRNRLLAFNYTLVDQVYDPGATSAAVTAALNEGRGIVNYCGHGSTGGWATTGFNSTHVNALVNDNMLPFIHSVACVNGNFGGTTCFAEAWLRANNNTSGLPTGAIAMYASSINQYWTPPMASQDFAIQHLVDEDYYSMGALWYNGSCGMINEYGASGADMFKTWHIFGDASLSYRTDEPGSMTVIHNAIALPGATFSVETGVSGALVCLSANGEILYAGYANSSGTISFNIPMNVSTDEHVLTVTAYNKITYIGYVDILMNYLWLGEYSTDWFNPLNWSNNEVPGIDDTARISGSKPNYPILNTGNPGCSGLIVNSGGQLTIQGVSLLISQDLLLVGSLIMNGPNSILEVGGDIFWKSGSSFSGNNSQNNKIYANGDWTFEPGASNVKIDSADVYFIGTNYTNIHNYGSGCGFRNLYLSKSPGVHVIFDTQSTSDLIISKNLTINTGVSVTHNSLKKLLISGNLTSNGNLYFQNGTCVLIGDDASIFLGNSISFFNNLEINANSGKSKTMASDILIHGDLNLVAGILNMGNFNLKLTSDLVKTGGNLQAGSGKFIFRGSDRQTISGSLIIPYLELAKPSDTLFINNQFILCDKYGWTEGTLAVTGFGSLMASDLADDGIYGSFYLKDNGEIALTQDAAQSVNLNGIIRIEDGNFTVNGGSGTSNWPGTVNSELWLSNGVLDFKNQGIHLSNSANFLEVITGGVIRTSKSFTGERNDFTPIGGRIELLGSGDADLSHGIGGGFWDVRIFKTGTVSAIQNLTVDNSVDIQLGTLDINGKTVHIESLLDISDELKMTLPSSQLSVIGDVIWRSGSSADISEGTIAFKGNWYFNNGTSAQLAGNNTVKATSVSTNQYVYHKDDDACFANFNLEKPFVTIQRHLILDNSSDYPMRVNGNLTLLSNNSLRIDSVEMIVGGNVQTNSTSFIRVYETGSLTAGSASIDGILNLFGGAFTANSATIDYGLVMTGNASVELNNLTLNGTIDLDDGSLVVHDNFSQSSGGHLVLDGGSFILDKPYTGNMFGFAGTTDLNGGFFEISYDGIQFGTGATVNFNGGTLRVGGHFRAVNANSFQPTSGTVELINTIGANIEVTNGNYFHRLVINKSGYNPCFPIYPLTVNDQMVLQQGEYYTFNQGLDIGDDLIIENLGKLTAGSAEIQVSGDWVNNRGTAGFVENTSSVWLTPAQTSTISSETFNELVIQASTTPGVYASMAPNSTITVNGDFILSEGALLMNDNCTLNANSVVFIKNGGGLNANPDATGTVINCPGHWWDYNTVANDQHSFTCGQSTVNFTGAGDQQVIAYPGAVFNHLNIQKTGGNLLPSNNITVQGNMNLQSGSWVHAATGLTNKFKGHFNVSSGAAWLDNQNTISFEGSQSQVLNNSNANTIYFGMLQVSQPTGGSRSGSLTIDSDINCLSAQFISGNISMEDHDFDCEGDMNILADASVEFLNNATIRMANNKLINVDGGSLFIGGDADNQPLVTRLSNGYYKIRVDNGGLMNAEYATFEYLHTRGIEFGPGGDVFGEYPFNHCTLKDGISNGSLLYMSSAFDITFHNVNFPANSWGGLYNVAEFENTGNVYLPGAIGGFAGPTFEYDPHNRVHWPSIGIWEGDESTEWHELHNWRYDFQVPDINTDVVIPSGVTYYPNFHQVETTVNSLRVDAGASLTISSDSLTVLTVTDIAGALNLTADYTALFTDSLVWQAGSSANVVNRGTIYVAGDMFIKRGSDLNMTTGTFYFHGNDDSDLICHDTAQVHHLSNYKTAPYSLNLVGDTVARLTVNGAFRNGPGATLKCPSTQEWVFKSHLRNTDNGHYRCQDGTIRLAGGMPSTYFCPNQGDYFNNLIIETTSALSISNTYSDTLRIHGNLTINPGTGTSNLTANNFKIMLMGDWINNKGTSGFIPGTSKVILPNSLPQNIQGNTIFYYVEAGSNSPGLVSFYGNNTIDHRLDIVAPVDVSGTLNANIVHNEDGNSALHIREGGYMQIGTLIQGGLVHTHNGTLIVNDLDEDYIFGTYVIDYGLVELNQEEYYSSHDLNGSITIYGGELRCTGGSGSSFWPVNLGGSYASLTMTGGLFNLPNHWIEIRNNSFTENITGGTIRVNTAFHCNAGVDTFTPTGGAVEIVSVDDSGVSIHSPNSHFWDLIINIGNYGGATYPTSNFKIKNELKVLSGKFHIDGFEITVGP